MTDQDAMKLALEALENSIDLVSQEARNAEELYGKYPTRLARIHGLVALEVAHEKAITALREALAEPPAMPFVPDAIHHTDTSEPLMYIQGWNDCRQAVLAEQPAQKRPQNCGTGYCSCIECVMEPAQREPAQRDTRNATLDEIATKIAAMPFGDTAASFAVWIREQKR